MLTIAFGVVIAVIFLALLPQILQFITWAVVELMPFLIFGGIIGLVSLVV